MDPMEDLQWRSVYRMSRAWTTCEKKYSQMAQESTALFKGIISSKRYLMGVKSQAVVALVFSSIESARAVMHRNLLRVAGYDISFLIHTSDLPYPPLHMERLRMRAEGLQDGQMEELSRPELHNPDITGAQPRLAQRAESDRGMRRRSERLLCRRRVSFLIGQEGGTVQ